MTKCAKCDGMSFRIQEMSPSGAQYKMYAIQCSNINCQAAIGVTEYLNVGSIVKGQEKAIADLQSKVNGMANTLNQIAHALNQMMQRR